MVFLSSIYIILHQKKLRVLYIWGNVCIIFIYNWCINRLENLYSLSHCCHRTYELYYHKSEKSNLKRFSFLGLKNHVFCFTKSHFQHLFKVLHIFKDIDPLFQRFFLSFLNPLWLLQSTRFARGNAWNFENVQFFNNFEKWREHLYPMDIMMFPSTK